VGKAGATIIGARPYLIAFNAYLNTTEVSIANKIAKAVRHSSGGYHFVKAMGLLVAGQAQVSMNLTDFTNTPIQRVLETVRSEAARYGALVTHTELVGLIPDQALVDAAQWYLQLDSSIPTRFWSTSWPRWTRGHRWAFWNAVASAEPAPGGGAVSARGGRAGCGAGGDGGASQRGQAQVCRGQR
jgi:glutamate formiminotransferase/formiminotetrahydrofolate cyclodeaminase